MSDRPGDAGSARCAVMTFGCRVNQADSLEIEAELRQRGLSIVPALEADVVVVNTCSVTASADQGARQTIRRIARERPATRIVVTGCYASRCADEVGSLPSVVSVVPNGRKHRLVEEMTALLGMTTADRYAGGEGACGRAREPGLGGRTAYTLRVQTGCDEPCAYCIIPSTRGRSRSRPLDDVLCEVDRVGAAGYREIILTGVHLGAYGRDLQPGAGLIDLLGSLDGRLPGVLLRVSSLEPMDCTREVVDLVARSATFAPHFHLPLQHGSDRMLAAMRRPYSAGYYRSLVEEIRRRLPDASIGSDLIVGFPGETDDDFRATVTLVEQSPLTHLHVFPYSDRPGTPAAAMGGRVPGEVIRSRAAEVRTAGQRLAERFRRSQVGSVRRGLTVDDGCTVVTDNYLKVAVAPGSGRNEWVNVRVLGAAGAGMAGEIVPG